MSTANTTTNKDYTSTWQDSMSDIAWGTLLLFMGIIVTYFIVITGALAESLSYPVASVICTYLCFACFTIQHDACHGNIFSIGSSFKFLEGIIGWVASIPLLVSPYRMFQKIHDRHHAFTNDPERDPDHFTFGTQWYQILLNSYYMPVKYYIMAFSTLKHVKIFRDTYVSTVVYTTLILSILTSLTAYGYGIEVLSFIIIPTSITLFLLVMFFDYLPHHPHKSLDRYHNARIYPSKLLNILLLGQNYHLLHHMYPRLPWYKYQYIFHEVLPDLEAKGAPIEDIIGGIRPGFMKSPNTKNLQANGKSVNMLLKVAEVQALTDDSVSVSFSLPEGEKLDFKAGQYITISKWLAGEQHTRCYSLCSTANNGQLKIGVKATESGLVSNYINEVLRAGDEIIVQGPYGDFVYPPAHNKNINSLVLIAGGSGITPMLSILLTALEQQNKIKIKLVYAVRNINNIMFLQTLEALQASHSNQLSIHYVINEPTDNDTPLQFFSVGRIDKTLLESVLPILENDENSEANTTALKTIENNTTEFYVCGPEGLKNEVLRTLQIHAIASERVHVEQFVPLIIKPEGELHKIDITLRDGQTHTLNVASNQTVLDVAKHEGVMLPHACGTGTCGTCKFKVSYGQITDIPKNIPALTANERVTGYTLACQCKPLSKLVLTGI